MRGAGQVRQRVVTGLATHGFSLPTRDSPQRRRGMCVSAFKDASKISNVKPLSSRTLKANQTNDRNNKQIQRQRDTCRQCQSGQILFIHVEEDVEARACRPRRNRQPQASKHLRVPAQGLQAPIEGARIIRIKRRAALGTAMWGAGQVRQRVVTGLATHDEISLPNTYDHGEHGEHGESRKTIVPAP
jgi:hypothetical protein